MPQVADWRRDRHDFRQVEYLLDSIPKPLIHALLFDHIRVRKEHSRKLLAGQLDDRYASHRQITFQLTNPVIP